MWHVPPTCGYSSKQDRSTPSKTYLEEGLMIRKRMLTAVLLMTMLLGMAPVLSHAAPEPTQATQQGPNLLNNPGFEADWGTEQSHRTIIFPKGGAAYEKPVENIFTPPGWVTWFYHDPQDDPTVGWDQPEVTDAWIHQDARRVRNGEKAIKLFTFYRRHDAGFYQVVGGLEPGASVQFSAYAQAWTCNEDNNDATSCGDPWAMVFRVGIDPQGGTNPLSSNVVWSGDHNSPDRHSLIGPVATQVGPQGTVTVFLRSTAKYAYKHMDAYWDDASLVTTSPGVPPTNTPLPEPPTPTPGPSPTPLPTSTPRPDGSVVHVVRSGDTLSSIALEYGVTVDQIIELNAGSIGPNNLIRTGQELVISVSGEMATATPLPEPPTATPQGETEASEGTETEAEPTLAPTEEQEGASICVLAFHDRNGDTVRDSDTEELLPNVNFTVANASGVVEEYSTDGVSEPYCFTGLAPGSYRVIEQAPAGYGATGLPEQNVALGEGTSFDFQFGNVRTEAATNPEETDEEGTESSSSEDESTGDTDQGPLLGNVLVTIARVAGILVLVLAGAIAVLFVLSRRRRY
jgi:LysM repeat protein